MSTLEKILATVVGVLVVAIIGISTHGFLTHKETPTPEQIKKTLDEQTKYLHEAPWMERVLDPTFGVVCYVTGSGTSCVIPVLPDEEMPDSDI